MHLQINTLTHKFHFALIPLFILVNLFVISFLPPVTESVKHPTPSSAFSNSQPAITYDGPNAVSNSFAGIADALDRTGDWMQRSVVSGLKFIAVSAINTRYFIVDIFKNFGLIIFNVFLNLFRFMGVILGIVHAGLSFAGNILSAGVMFAITAPANVLNFFLNTAAASAVIQPGRVSQLPVIDTSPKSQLLVVSQVSSTTIKTASAVRPPAQPAPLAPSWPIHGQVTTLFGVPHWPYQPTHTGIDISSGQRSGVTAVRPFKPGKVVEVIHSNVQLGNHVVIDHGDGITSVYGHMYSLAVQVGQEVNQDTVIGYEGSTGASTGTHLHFEIRLNGQPVNPTQYVSGQP